MVEYLPPLPAGRTPSQEWCLKYVKSLSGILKIVEMVLALAMFICACQAGRAFGWVDLVGISSIFQAAAFFVIHIINCFPDAILAFIIELIVYVVFTVFYLGAFINCAVSSAEIATWKPSRHYSNYYPPAVAATVFCTLCLIVWAVDTVLLFIAMNRRRSQPPPPQPSSGAAMSTTSPS